MSASSLRSMTGFGSARVEISGGVLAAEVRCVNSRHLDVKVRLPRELIALESALRTRVGAFFGRGQAEASVRLPRELEGAARVEIDRGAAREYAQAAEELRTELSLEGGLSLSTLLGLPGVARQREPELDAEALRDVVFEAVDGACAAAAAMREREGQALERELRQRVEAVALRVERIASHAEEVHGAQRERLIKRLASLAPDLEVDPARLEQEVVLSVDRMDITEETVRLHSHCAQFLEALEADGPVGRKLEFILQEMGREANTAGSKASGAPVAREVVELKAELERLREQILNVE